MWIGIAIVGLLIWIGISYFTSGRDRIMRGMKSNYSRQEAFEIINESRRQFGIIFLMYGVILGALIVAALKD